MISTPLNPLAAHIGNGTIALYWDAPATGTPVEYQVRVSETLSGTYVDYGRSLFTVNRGLLRNLPLRQSTYIRIRAIDSSGNTSSWGQFKKARLKKAQTTLHCRCVSGSRIPEGATFTRQDDGGLLIGFTADEQIDFTE